MLFSKLIKNIFIVSLLICQSEASSSSSTESLSTREDSIHQFDITRTSELCPKILQTPCHWFLKIFKNPILSYTEPLVSRFMFDSQSSVVGLENAKGTCFAATLFQALNACPEFHSLIEGMATREDEYSTGTALANLFGEDSQVPFLATTLRDLFEAMKTGNADIKDLEPKSLLGKLLVKSLRLDPKVKGKYVKDVEETYYKQLANELRGISSITQLEKPENDLLDEVAMELDEGSGSVSGLIVSLWIALNNEYKILYENDEGINQNVSFLSIINDGSAPYISPITKLTVSDQMMPIVVSGKNMLSSKYSGPYPSVLILLIDKFFNPYCTEQSFIKNISATLSETLMKTFNQKPTLPIGKEYKLKSIVYSHNKSLLTGEHATAMVLSSNGNWNLANNEFVFHSKSFRSKANPVMLLYELVNEDAI